MNPHFCPYCGQPIASKLNRCSRCGWRPIKPDSPKIEGVTACLSVALFLSMIVGNVGYQALSASTGDEFGYGQSSVLECGILLLTSVWLAVSIALRTAISVQKRHANIRAAAGFALSAVAIILAFSNLGSVQEVRTVVLLLSGVGLILSSAKSMRATA